MGEAASDDGVSRVTEGLRGFADDARDELADPRQIADHAHDLAGDDETALHVAPQRRLREAVIPDLALRNVVVVARTPPSPSSGRCAPRAADRSAPTMSVSVSARPSSAAL
jgi:hypothetical protein